MNVTISFGQYMGDSQPTHFTGTKNLSSINMQQSCYQTRPTRTKDIARVNHSSENYTTNPQPRTDVSSKSYHAVQLSDWAAVCTTLDLHKSLEKNLEIRCRPDRSTSLTCTKAWHRYRNKQCQAIRTQYNRCKITMFIRCYDNNDRRNISLIYLQEHTS